MSYRSIDLLLVIAFTIIAVTSTFTVIPGIVSVRILTLPLVFVLPGYALMSALLPRRAFGVPELLVFSMGLSMTTVILGGLVLNLTPFGLRANSWAVLLTGIILGACAVAFVRRRRQNISTPGWLGVGDIGLTFRQGLLLGLAALIVCGAVAVSIIGAERQSYPGFTQLWILPAGGANPENAVRLGVSNMESAAMEYRLDVDMDSKVVKVWPFIDLKPNEKWETILVLPQTRHVGATRVEAILYCAAAPTRIYRQVVLWLGT